MAMRPYQPRAVARLAPVIHGDWTLKSYSIVYGTEPFDPARFTGGLPLALACLPQPAVTPDRLGVGFVIEHQGRQIDYLVLGWWDRQNELPLRIFVRDYADDGKWRPARGSESVCVWDLEVIWHERQAYVDTVMRADSTDGEDRYLQRTLTHGS
jgi:hypothetical protein